MYSMEQVFNLADEDNKGFLTKDDIKAAVIMLVGHKPSKSEVVEMIETYGSEHHMGERGLSLTQFIEAMKPKLAAVDEDEQIRSSFLAFDTKCRGFLIAEDLKQAFKQQCPHFPEHRVDLVFRELDRDGDGRVSYKDFDFMMKFDNLS